MKKLLFFFCLIVAAGCSQAQNKTNIDHIPVYRILTADSVYCTQANLKKNKPVMIVYFSPDCSHCQHLMYEMKENMKAFSKVQVVMITPVQHKLVKNFYRDFGIAKYPNFTVGSEDDYAVLRYYDVHTTPYVAIYNNKGKLYKAFPQQPTVKDLMATLKKI